MEPQRIENSKGLVGEAFGYWQRTLFFQVLFSILYFIIFFTLTFLIFNYFGLIDKIKELSAYLPSDVETFREKYTEIIQTQDFIDAQLWAVVSTVVAWPLNLGMLKIYQKLDRKEHVAINDLFTGYEGKRFFVFLLYALFWNSIYSLTKLLIILPVVWVLITLLVGPLMFLRGLNFRDAFRLNIRVFQENWSVSISVMVFGFLISYAGFLLCGFGLLFTFPFWNALLYVYFKKLFPQTQSTVQ